MTQTSSTEQSIADLLQNKDKKFVIQQLEGLYKQQPKNIEILSNLAICNMQIQYWDKACDWYVALLKIEPNNAVAFCNFGTAKAQMGDFESALQNFNQAINLQANYPLAQLNKSRTLQALSEGNPARKAEAIESLKTFLSLQPNEVAKIMELADLLRESERFTEAIFFYDEYLKHNPQSAVAWNNRGIALKNLGKPSLAIESYTQAIQQQPDYAFAYSNRGNVLFNLEKYDEAIEDYEQTLKLDPQFVSALTSMGSCFLKKREIEKAEKYYRQALQIQPDYAEAWNDHGNILRELCKPAEAIKSFNRAIELRKDLPGAYWNASHAYLMNDEFELGWKMFEYRWGGCSEIGSARHTNHPLWLGKEDLQGKTLLIHTEQGLGDSLQFCRYINQVKKLGARLILEIDPQLLKIFSSLKALTDQDTIIAKEQKLPHFDFQCPLLSLPLALKLFSKQSLMGEVPYLFAEQEKIAFWKEKLGTKTKPRIGLVWSGGFRPNQPELWTLNTRRNIDFKQIAQLHMLKQFDFYSLQKGEPAESEFLKIKDQYWKTENLHIFTQSIQDWTDTAGLIHHLDLIISVDTSVLHLAGAMGKPIWLLNRFDTCWRWGIDRENSYWYPNLRIFRQNKDGNWQKVIQQVTSALSQMFSEESQTMQDAKQSISPQKVISQEDILKKLYEAVAFHQARNFEKAKEIYQEILEIDPQNGDALHLLGTLESQSGNYETAIKLIDQAIAIQEHPNFFNNRGNALSSSGRLDDAIADFDKVIKADPNHTDALYNRGSCLYTLARYELALQDFLRVTAIDPQYAEAYNNQGSCLSKLGRHEEAILSYQQAIQLKPNYAEAIFGRGVSLQELKKYEEAETSYAQASALVPNNFEAWYSLGNVQNELRQFKAAIQSYTKAIELNPKHPMAYHGRGVSQYELGLFAETLNDYNKAIEIDDSIAELYSGRGLVLQNFNRMDASIADLKHAIKIKSDYPELYLNLAIAQLLNGDFKEGWTNYERRWEIKALEKFKKTFKSPMWTGEEDLTAKTIYIRHEQGMGDILQFCRYIPYLKAQGANVIVEADSPVLRLLTTIPMMGTDDLLIEKDAEIPIPYDYYCAALSLPYAFKTFSIADIPTNIPYLYPIDEKVFFWKDKLGEKTKPRIGLVWSGGFRPDHPELWSVHARRDMDFKWIAELSDLDFDFYSLQKGDPAESKLLQIKDQYWKTDNLHILTEHIKDFTDTAGLIYHLDLVISVDTSVLHLAGAMGKPVWLLNRVDTCWRWLQSIDTSPWYPSMRIFRQHQANEWEDVIQNVKTALKGQFSST